ncbi:MAG: HDOD domain-containing protein, partial [Planctomycetota bacterium]
MPPAPDQPEQMPDQASPAAGSGQDRGRQVELILRQVDELPTLSPIASRLVELGSSDDVEIDEVAALIESDPALTARILKMCMRADRGLGDRITSVRQAIVLLGLPAVQSAVLSVCVYELMERAGRDLDTRLGEKAAEESAFDRAGLWRHCVAVACASRFIAERATDAGVKPDEAFVAGLLHELGKMALELVLPRAYSRVVSLAERRSSDASPVEQAVLGLDHFVAGRRLAQRWGLPAGLVEVAWLHGQMPEALPEGSEVRLVSVVGAAK